MIVDIYSCCWTPWKHPCFVIDGEESIIYFLSPGGPYWCFDNKIYFGTYQSLHHWEIKLYVSQTSFPDQLKNIGKQLRSEPSHLLLHWGSNIPKFECFFPGNNETAELTTKKEKSCFSQTVCYHHYNKMIAKIHHPGITALLSGKVARIFVDDQHDKFLPYLLGSMILTGIST